MPYQHLFEEAADGILFADKSGTILHVNPAGAALLGGSTESIVGKNFADFLPDTQRRRLEGFRRRYSQPHSRITRWKARRSDGTWIPVEVNARLAADGGWTVVVRELRHPDRTDQRLRAAEAKYQALFENAIDPIVVVGSDGTIRLANPRASEVFGYRPGELIGQPMEVLVPDAVRDRHRELRHQFLKTPHGRPMAAGRDLLVRRKDGSSLSVDIALSPCEIVGEGMLITAVIRDMTERKAREKEQRILSQLGGVLSASLTLNDRLQAAATVLAESVCAWALIDVLDERGALRRLAVAGRDASQSALAERLRRSAPTAVNVSGILKCIDEQKAIVVTDVDAGHWKQILADDPERLALALDLPVTSYMVLPLTARGRALGAVTLIAGEERYDENAAVAVEPFMQRIALATDNARLYEAAQAAVRAREETLAIVSHDLQSPLSVVTWSLQSLRRERATLTTAELDPLLERMERAMGRASALIADLLDFAKMQEGRFTVTPQAERPEALALAAIAEFQSAAEAQQTQLVFVEDSTLPSLPAVVADRRQVLRVLSNLLGNALKFTPAGGKVSLALTKAANAVRFSVTDNGIGIPAEALPHLFERYWQPERSRAQGTGLGLAIAKGIVEAHGGHIGVESVEGHGSTFFFTLHGVVASH